MFKSRASEGGSAGDTIIAAGVKVEGDFTSEGNIVIEGEVVGSLKTTQDLIVGEHARIVADVAAASARISGEVRGNMTVTDKLELAGTSRITGDVHARVLIVESGATLNGRVLMNAEASAVAREEEAAAEPRAAGLSALVGGRKAKEASA